MNGKDYRHIVDQELRGCSGIQTVYGKAKRHPFVVLRSPTGSVRLTFADTPSDHRALANFRASVRRTCRELSA